MYLIKYQNYIGFGILIKNITSVMRKFTSHLIYRNLSNVAEHLYKIIFNRNVLVKETYLYR